MSSNNKPTTPSLDDVIDIEDYDSQTSQNSEPHQVNLRQEPRSVNEPAYTVTSGLPSALLNKDNLSVKYITDLDDYRRLTVGEIQKIQSFPDQFTFYPDNKTKIRELIGNAVPPELSESIARSLKDELS